MADRMPPYQMNPLQNFMSQQHMQQQSQQQQQQQQQQDSQMVPGLPNPEHSRIWTQMQNYRAQSNGDANSAQMNPQVSFSYNLLKLFSPLCDICIRSQDPPLLMLLMVGLGTVLVLPITVSVIINIF
jgi:hypothetical protein